MLQSLVLNESSRFMSLIWAFRAGAEFARVAILSADEEAVASKIYCQFEAKSCHCSISSMTAYNWQVFAKRLQGAWGDSELQEQPEVSRTVKTVKNGKPWDPNVGL